MCTCVCIVCVSVGGWVADVWCVVCMCGDVGVWVWVRVSVHDHLCVFWHVKCIISVHAIYCASTVRMHASYCVFLLFLLQLCVIHRVTMGSVLLTTLASVLVDTVDPHAANQVRMYTSAQLHIAVGRP